MKAALFDLSGRTALVTGGARGIGLACAASLLENGAHVIITSRREAAGSDAVNCLSGHGTAELVVGDLGTFEGTEEISRAVIARLERLDILVNNAGGAWQAPLQSYPDRAWSKLLQLNMVAPFQLIQQLLPLLQAAAAADYPSRVINIGSLDGHVVGPFENYAYSASKASLHHLSQVLAHQLGGRNISVNCVAPGPVRTKMTEELLDNNEADLLSSNPLGRFADVEDVANMVTFLASGAATYVSGAVIPVDGGYSVRPWGLR